MASQLERIDVTDRLFARRFGMLAPGKSYPLAMGEGPPHEERRAKWSEWFATGDAWRDHVDLIVELEAKLDRLSDELDELRESAQREGSG